MTRMVLPVGEWRGGEFRPMRVEVAAVRWDIWWLDGLVPVECWVLEDDGSRGDSCCLLLRVEQIPEEDAVVSFA